METPLIYRLLGGRKMTVTWVAIIVGTVIELMTERGLSPTFAAFLAGAVASFSAANVVNTVKMSVPKGDDPRIEQLQTELTAAKEAVNADMGKMATTIEQLANALAQVKQILLSIGGKKS